MPALTTIPSVDRRGPWAVDATPALVESYGHPLIRWAPLPSEPLPTDADEAMHLVLSTLDELVALHPFCDPTLFDVMLSAESLGIRASEWMGSYEAHQRATSN